MGICNDSIDFIPLQENKEIYFLFMWFVQKLTKAGNYMTKGEMQIKTPAMECLL